LAALIFEVPTGAFSDIYGRKVSVIFGWTLQGVIMILIFFASSFYTILFLFFLFGISQTFVSGSYEAWVVDLLNGSRLKKVVKTYFTKRYSLFNLGFVFSGIIGAILVSKFGLGIIWPMSGVAMFISVLFLSFGKEIFHRKKKSITNSVKLLYDQTRTSAKYGYKHHVLFYLFIIIFILGFAGCLSGLNVWTPLLKESNLEDKYFGYLWSLSGLIGVFVPFISSKLTAYKKEKKTIVAVMIIFLLGGIFILFVNRLFIFVLLFLLHFSLIDSYTPIWNTYFHRFIPGKLRATIGSFQGLLISLAAIVGMAISGYLVDNIGARETIFISGLLMIPMLLLFLRVNEKKIKPR
jgi:MFS family permease